MEGLILLGLNGDKMIRPTLSLLLLGLLLTVGAVKHAAAEDPSFLNNILKHLDQGDESFSDSFARKDLSNDTNEVVLYAPGPSTTPLVPKRNELNEMIDSIKAVAGIGPKQHFERLIETLETNFGADYRMPTLNQCRHSRIITRKAAKPSLMPDEDLGYLYFDATNRSLRPKTYRFGRHAIPYTNGQAVSRVTENQRLPLYLAEVSGIICLPTYVRSLPGDELEFHEGDAAWQTVDSDDAVSQE